MATAAPTPAPRTPPAMNDPILLITSIPSSSGGLIQAEDPAQQRAQQEQHRAQPSSECGGSSDIDQRSHCFAGWAGVDRDIRPRLDRGPVGFEHEDPASYDSRL